MEHRFPPVKEKYEARYCWRLPAGKGWERLGLRRDGDCVIIKAQKMMGHYDFAAAGSSVRKNSWVVCLYGIKANGYLAISYGDFGRIIKPESGALAERSGIGWVIKS